MEKGHINWIDYGKSAAIFFVVLLHTHCDVLVDCIINAFIMPVFFFMSGVVFSYDRNPRYGAFVLKRFWQLVVPYVWINVLAYLLWLFVLRHYGADADSDIAWLTPLVGFLAGVPPMLSHDIPLWALLCFFVVELIFYPLCKSLMRDWLVAIVFAAIAFAMTFFVDGGRLPLTIGPAIAGVAFYALGHYYQRVGRTYRILNNPLFVLLAIIAFALSVIYNSEVEFFICRFGDYCLFLLGAISAIVIMVALTKMFGRYIKEPRAIKFIARSTLLICGFHLLAFAAIKGVLLLGFGIDPAVLSDGIWHGLLYAVTAFAMTLPAAYIVFRYFPWLVDK